MTPSAYATTAPTLGKLDSAANQDRKERVREGVLVVAERCKAGREVIRVSTAEQPREGGNQTRDQLNGESLAHPTNKKLRACLLLGGAMP